MKLLLIIASLCHFTSVLADNCSYVNLTDKNQVFHQVPTYDQIGSQICFAFSAAQMIEGQRVAAGHKYKPEESISPFSIALSMALAAGNTNLQAGGVACKAVEHAKKFPVCPTSKTFKSAEEMELLIKDFEECKKGKNACEKIRKQLGDKSDEILKQNNPVRYVKAVEDLRCSDKDKIKLNIPGCDYLNDEAQPSNEFRRRVDKVFNSKLPMPLEIGYSMNLFNYDAVEKKKYQIQRVREEDVFAFSIKYKPHSSVLLGRKKGKNGQCQYLLRNSQGSAFCPIGIAKKFGWECTKEGIWINHTELFESTFQISNFEEANLEKMLSQCMKDLNKTNAPPGICEKK